MKRPCFLGSFFASMAFWAAFGALPIWAGDKAPRFSTVAPGITHATFEVRPADGEPFSGHAFTIDLGEAELRLVPAGGHEQTEELGRARCQWQGGAHRTWLGHSRAGCRPAHRPGHPPSCRRRAGTAIYTAG